MSQIKQIKVNNTIYDVGLFTPTFAALFSMSGDYSNNLTIGKYAASNGTVKHINLESGVVTENGSTKRGDIQLKPCDDIAFYSHHREAGKQDEVHITAAQSYTPAGATSSVDYPVKLQLNCADLTLSSKGKDLTKVYSNISSKTGNGSDADSDVFNINVTKFENNANKKGYLKVRAKAIDLRCEDHGGIALLPKGVDSDNRHNKVKFEHGGGDGLEFFTMNDEKMSAFVDEYRFNKAGLWYMATRTKVTSDKAAAADVTTSYKYQKNTEDDFYDNIDTDDAIADTEAIIKTANAFNYGKDRHAKRTGSGNIEIETMKTYKWASSTETATLTWEDENTSDITKVYNEDDFDTMPTIGTIYQIGSDASAIYTLQEVDAPEIKINSGTDLTLKSDDDIIIEPDDAVKINAAEVRIDATDDISFGTTPKLNFLTNKITKKAKIDTNDTLFVSGILNNMEVNIAYNTSTGAVRVPVLTTIYTDTEHDYPYYPSTDKVGVTKVTLYDYDGNKLTADSNYFVKDESGNVWCVPTTGKSKDNNDDDDYKLLTGTDGYDNVTFLDSSTTLTAETNEVIVAPGEMASGGDSCSVADIIKFISWCKTNNEGPWAS